ncbi:MAG: YkgJ family cysteine cluster protein [Candidatus Kariarchaeaceae archaeon]
MEEQKHICTACIEQTGGCCTDIEISMYKEEAAPFLKLKEEGKLPEGHTVTQHKNDEDIWEYHSNEEACVFLDPVTKGCNNYEKRPVICRTYPVQWTKVKVKKKWLGIKKKKKKKKMQFFLDTYCPLSHRVPLNDFHRWMDDLPDPSYVKKIGELDFEYKDRQYINLTVIQNNASPPEIARDLRLRV